MLNSEQTQILEEAIFLLFKLRNDQSVDNWEEKRAREFNNQIFGKNEQTFYFILQKRRKQMPIKYREIFTEQWFKEHTRLKPNGIYEVRCTINKTPISGGGRDLDTAIGNFIQKLVDFERGKKAAKPKKTIEPKRKLFNEFSEEWLEVVKKPTVKPITYNSFRTVYKVHIKPYFLHRFIDELTAMQIQPLFTKLFEQKKSKAAQDVKLLLNQIFKAAIAERYIQFNPMDGVKVLKHHAKNGKALTYEEEHEFLRKLDASRFKLTFAIMLFGGMRRAELATVRFEGGFIIVKDGKRRLSQVETERKIPVTPMLKPFIENPSEEELREAIGHSCDLLSRAFKELCPAHHLHELRHTFITRCQECGVAREVVSVWAGHSADSTMTSTVYTHFSEEFMLSEGQKVDYYNRLK